MTPDETAWDDWRRTRNQLFFLSAGMTLCCVSIIYLAYGATLPFHQWWPYIITGGTALYAYAFLRSPIYTPNNRVPRAPTFQLALIAGISMMMWRALNPADNFFVEIASRSPNNEYCITFVGAYEFRNVMPVYVARAPILLAPSGITILAIELCALAASMLWGAMRGLDHVCRGFVYIVATTLALCTLRPELLLDDEALSFALNIHRYRERAQLTATFIQWTALMNLLAVGAAIGTLLRSRTRWPHALRRYRRNPKLLDVAKV